MPRRPAPESAAAALGRVRNLLPGLPLPERLDWEAAGLLDGLTGPEREARRELLQQLADDGVPVEDLRRAVEEGRLALLPVERVLAGGERRYTVEDVARESGLEVSYLERLWRALGFSTPDPDEFRASETEIEAACAVARFLEAGIPPDGMLEMARVAGQSMSMLAATIRAVFEHAYLEPGSTERDIGLRYATAAERLGPEIGPLLLYALRARQREQIAHEVVRWFEAEGPLPGAREVAVCFADLVGFTGLSEDLGPEEVGGMARRLDDLAVEAAVAPVQLVKTIGDAVMLVSPDADALLEAALALSAAVEDDSELPALRTGLAAGPAIMRGGDWFGRPVNVADRVSKAARPGDVLATEEVRERASGSYAWSRVRRRSLKGVSGWTKLYKVAPAPDADAA